MANVSIFGSRGFSLQFQLGKSSRPPWLDGSLRGRLSGQWSSASQRRFREFCLTHDFPAACWGITLTVPGSSILQHWYFAHIFHKFSQALNKLHLPLIWRIELQQRGMAHAHCVVYTDSTHDLLRLCSCWYRVLSFRQRCLLSDDDFAWMPSSYLPGANYAVHIESLSGDHRSYRYLVAHESKAKRAQLGYVGRQWGVVNRRFFHTVEAFDIPIEDHDYFVLLRWIRRLTRSRCRRDCAFWVSDPCTLRRMLNFLGYTV